MKKTLKSLLKIIIALVILFFIASIAITLFVDINQYKKEISQLVEKEAGLKLEINGDMKLTVFSGLKFHAKDVKIFRGEELIADITSLQLGMEAYSIYIGEPEVTSVKLEVKTLNIFRDKNNQLNFLPLYDNKAKSKNKSAQNSTQKSADSTDKLDLNYLALKNIQLSIDRFQYLDDLESVSVKLNQVKASLSLLPIIDHHELVIDDPRVLIAYNYSGELELKQALINQYQISNLSLSFKDQKGDFIADKLSFSFIQEGAQHKSPPIIFDAKGNLSFKLLYKTQKGSSEPLWSQPDLIKVGKFDFDLPKLKLTQKQFQLETENAHLDFEELAIFESKKYLLDNLVLQSMNFNSKKITLNLKSKGKDDEYLFKQSILKLNNFPVIHKGKPLDIMSDTFLRKFAQKGDIIFTTDSISHESQALKNIKIALKGKNNKISLSKFSFNAMDSKLDGEGSLLFFAENKKKIPEWHLKVHSEKLNLQPLSELLEFPAQLKGYLTINSNLSGDFYPDTWGDSKFTVDAGHVKTSGKNILIDGIDIDKVLADFQNSQSVGLLDVGAITLLGPAGMLVTKSNDYHKLINTLDNKGNSEFEQLNSEISFSDGIATLEDVAFSTMKNRLAIKGKINTDNNTFITFKVATIDKNGCPIYAEEVKGSLDSPSVKKVNVLISGVVNPISSLLSKVTKTLNMTCKEPFYAGVVKAPVK